MAVSLVERFKDDNLLSSESLRKKMTNISDDIILAYSNIEEAQETIKNMSVLNSIENSIVSSYITNLEARLEDLENNLFSDSLIMTKNYFNPNGITVEKGELNTNYGFLSTQLKSDAKIDFFHYPLAFLIENFNIELKVIKNGNVIKTVSLKEDLSLINILNNNIYEGYLLSTTLASTDQNHLEYELTIGFPTSALSSLAINQIILHPSPLYSLTLNKAEYLTNSGEYVEIKDIPSKSGLKNENFIIDTILTNQLRFSFSQYNFFSNNGKKEFVFGIRNLFVNYITQLSNEISWISKYELNDVFAAKINGIYLKTNQDLAYEKHELFLDKEMTKKIITGQELSEPTNEIYIKHTVGTYNNEIVVIEEEGISVDL